MKDRDKKSCRQLFVTQNRVDPFVCMGAIQPSSAHYWQWGDDNQFPYALALLSRRSTTHRRIINDKADYISGKGFSYDSNIERLGDFVGTANAQGESLREVVNKLAFDKALFGNAFAEVVTDLNRSFLSVFHQDASKCRVAKDSKHVILHHNWAEFTPTDAKTLPLYPAFEQADDNT